jgi:hypothetical protein
MAVAVGGAWALRLATWETHDGYFGPAFSPDGRYVFAVERRTTGITWGPGWEFFTPPAHAWTIADRVRLIRVEAETGRADVLRDWPSSPITSRTIQEYRGRVFAPLHVALRPEASRVRYTIELSIPKVPASEIYGITGVWEAATGGGERGEWQQGGGAAAGASEPVVAGDTEVFAVRGPEMFPSALVLLDHRTSTVRPIAYSSAYRREFPRGVPIAELLAVSRKPQHDREAAFKARYDERLAVHRGEGMRDGDAILRTYRDLEDLGYLPRTPKLVAREIAAADESAPRFDIADAEMASGVFNDIEKAIGAPGTEVEKSSSSYITHRDYNNSRRLNTYLEGGGRAFIVHYRGKLYRMEIR